MKRGVKVIFFWFFIVIIISFSIFSSIYLYHRLKAQDIAFRNCISKISDPDYLRQLLYSYEYEQADKFLIFNSKYSNDTLYLQLKNKASMADFETFKIDLKYVQKSQNDYSQGTTAVYFRLPLPPNTQKDTLIVLYNMKNLLDATVVSVKALTNKQFTDQGECSQVANFSKGVFKDMIKSIF